MVWKIQQRLMLNLRCLEADSEEAVSEVDKKVKVPKSKRFGKKESATACKR